jgi:DNA ligase D-like protein (predicted 3'-phosphoesterase)
LAGIRLQGCFLQKHVLAREIKIEAIQKTIMGLEEYKKKRDLQRTPEPSGRVKPGPIKHVYVIQEHRATHLHYDLRLEIGGVLKSWALPKEPPSEEGIKRLAVQTEDHPLDYAGFEGVIPEGQYGAGEVKTWDKGSYEMISRKEHKMVLRIHGKRLNGDYVILRLKQKGNWLFFKKKEGSK